MNVEWLPIDPIIMTDVSINVNSVWVVYIESNEIQFKVCNNMLPVKTILATI